jgi:hypothetical protein
VIRRFAPLLLLAGAVLLSAEVKAAIFRIQGATYADDGTFGNGSFKISGEIRVLTSFRNADGSQNAQAGNVLQAWNIVVKDSSNTVLTRFVNGYSDPVMGGYTNNSTKGGNSTNTIQVTCSVVANGCSNQADTLGISFGQNFNDFIGNSYDPSGNDSSAVISNGSIVYTNQSGTTVGNTVAQADFVPFQAASACFIPIGILIKRLKNRFYF